MVGLKATGSGIRSESIARLLLLTDDSDLGNFERSGVSQTVESKQREYCNHTERNILWFIPWWQ